MLNSEVIDHFYKNGTIQIALIKGKNILKQYLGVNYIFLAQVTKQTSCSGNITPMLGHYPLKLVLCPT